MSEVKTTINVPNVLLEGVHNVFPFSYRIHAMEERSISTPNLATPLDRYMQLILDEQLLANMLGLTVEPHIGELKRLYGFRDDQVEAFLEENPSLVNLLLETHEIIREHFGSEVEAALEVLADPEALGDRQLFVLIRTKLPRKEARTRLAELDRGWWLNALPAADGKMEIALA